jgi:hypothetical protein
MEYSAIRKAADAEFRREVGLWLEELTTNREIRRLASEYAEILRFVVPRCNRGICEMAVVLAHTVIAHSGRAVTPVPSIAHGFAQDLIDRLLFDLNRHEQMTDKELFG